MNRSFALALCWSVLATPVFAAVTPPKDGTPPATSDGSKTARTRELERVRGGVAIGVWLELLSKETVRPLEREPITKLVREYQQVVTLWETSGKKAFDGLMATYRAGREAGEEPSPELLKSIRIIRASRPQILKLQESVWRRLSKNEQVSFLRALDEFKRRAAEEARAKGQRAKKSKGTSAIPGAQATSAVPKAKDKNSDKGKTTATSKGVPWSFVSSEEPAKKDG